MTMQHLIEVTFSAPNYIPGDVLAMVNHLFRGSELVGAIRECESRGDIVAPIETKLTPEGFITRSVWRSAKERDDYLAKIGSIESVNKLLARLESLGITRTVAVESPAEQKTTRRRKAG